MLKKCQNDEDEEVRERALLILNTVYASEPQEEEIEAVFNDDDFDVDQLEQYLLANKDQLINQEDNFSIELNSLPSASEDIDLPSEDISAPAGPSPTSALPTAPTEPIPNYSSTKDLIDDGILTHLGNEEP